MNILKEIKKNTLVLLLITIIVLYVILKDDWLNISKALTTMDVKYLILAVIVFLISVSLKGIANYLIVNDKKKISVKEAIKHNFITQFFNGITPFSTGGQPMEIYMLTEHGISLPKATNYTVQSFIFYQIALVICGALAVTYNFIFKIFKKIPIIDNFLFFDNSLNPLYKSSNLVSISSSFPFIFNFLQDFLHRLLNFCVVFFEFATKSNITTTNMFIANPNNTRYFKNVTLGNILNIKL